jgi:nitrogen-specific signal transduction histidine kinase
VVFIGYLQQYFDPFFTTKLARHGLGLTVVQGIVWSLSGTIRLVSPPGEGMTFQISLPSVEETALPSPRTYQAAQETVAKRLWKTNI